MKSQDQDYTPSVVTSRRRFLKSSGAAGIALAGGLGTQTSFSSNESEPAIVSVQCTFSELPADFVYLNSGTEGSMPSCVISEFQNGLERWASDPTSFYETDPAYGKRQEMNRTKVAQFLGVGMNNICLSDNTTMGLSMTLMGLDIRPGDRVVMTNHEHTAMKSPLRVLQARIGLKVTKQFFPPADVLNELNADELLDTLLPIVDELKGAKALCVSHVYPTTGVRLPLRALRKKADELEIQYLVVDGAQAMGMIDLTADEDNIEHCDFYACPGHKWLNGPPSTGVLYLRNADIRPPEFYPTISQRMENYVDCDEKDSDYFPMAEALQVRGCSNTLGFSAMLRAMEFAQDAGGSTAVEKHILRLSKQVKEILLSRAPHCIVSPHIDAALLSGLTAFFPFRWDNPRQLFTDRKTADWVVAELMKEKIQVRSIGFENSGPSDEPSNAVYAIRVSTGFFNTDEQVEMFEGALQEVLMRV
jgi:selenocysteine lyase/cysteine desulfurase